MDNFADSRRLLKKANEKIKNIQEEILNLLNEKKMYRVYFNSFLDCSGLKIKSIDKNLIIYTKEGKGTEKDYKLTPYEWEKVLNTVKKELGIK